MSTFGIFNDEGLIEDDHTESSANDAVKSRYPDDDTIYVAECCYDHPEYDKDACEVCNSDDTSDNTEED